MADAATRWLPGVSPRSARLPSRSDFPRERARGPARELWAPSAAPVQEQRATLSIPPDRRQRRLRPRSVAAVRARGSRIAGTLALHVAPDRDGPLLEERIPQEVIDVHLRIHGQQLVARSDIRRVSVHRAPGEIARARVDDQGGVKPSPVMAKQCSEIFMAPSHRIRVRIQSLSGWSVRKSGVRTSPVKRRATKIPPAGTEAPIIARMMCKPLGVCSLPCCSPKTRGQPRPVKLSLWSKKNTPLTQCLRLAEHIRFTCRA